MSNTLGTLLTDNAYTAAGYTAALAARTTWESGQQATATLAKKYPLLAVVGDMVSDPDYTKNADTQHRDQLEGTDVVSRFKQVSDLVVDSHCTHFACLGDNVYENGQLTNYLYGYEQTFGRANGKCLPLPGNHEYQTPGAADYFTYFGGLAGPSGLGYYAVNIGNWRYYTLNTNNALFVAPNSAQCTWFIADMAANRAKPKVVAWHHPRWTDGASPGVTDDPNQDYLWQLMYADGHVQIALSGHDHNYQRWDTIKTSAVAGDTDGRNAQGVGYPPTTVADGITQFVVGCGGHGFFTLSPPRPGPGTTNLNGGPGNAGRSTFGTDRHFGVLFLRLGPTSWDFSFRNISGVEIDSGTRTIH